MTLCHREPSNANPTPPIPIEIPIPIPTPITTLKPNSPHTHHCPTPSPQTIRIEAQDQQIECFTMSKDGKTCYSGALDGRGEHRTNY